MLKHGSPVASPREKANKPLRVFGSQVAGLPALGQTSLSEIEGRAGRPSSVGSANLRLLSPPTGTQARIVASAFRQLSLSMDGPPLRATVQGVPGSCTNIEGVDSLGPKMTFLWYNFFSRNALPKGPSILLLYPIIPY